MPHATGVRVPEALEAPRGKGDQVPIPRPALLLLDKLSLASDTEMGESIIYFY